MQIRINGSANLSQARAEFAALEAQVVSLNATMAKGAAMPNGKGMAQHAAAVESASQAYRNSLQSSGAFRTEQMKLNSATSHYTELLQKQKLSFAEVFGPRNRNLMRSIYQEQLKMQDLQARPVGKGGMYDVSIPRAYREELDTLNKRLNFTGAQLKSAGTHMVNWGKNTQWAGRQLTVGLTMPVVALGAAAAVMAYKVDQQMTRVRKVYNTTADQSSKDIKDMQAVQAEFAKLNKDSWNTVTDATERYASSATDTLGVQAELAAAGQKGAKLQAATTQVMKSAMLGEIDYQTATSATIALQQQLHLSTTDLADSWAYMNSVENSTSLQMKDFAAAIPIALGPIRQMGGDLQDLGTLMTAMISRGVQVGKAANAIKALPQRLSNPTKATQEMFKKLTGQDIVELNKKNPNNIIGLLTDIENATKDLGNLGRRQVLSKLFGTYQLSTMSAMLQGMEDLQNGIGQTSTAFKIGEQSAEDWQRVSDQEISQLEKSVSFKFKKMINEIKNESVEFGRPFLEVATAIGTGVAKAMSAFSSMPKIFKILAAGGFTLAALAGPLLMLVGLMGNLGGNAFKAAGSILSYGKALILTTKEERAMAVAHEQAQVAMAGYINRTTTESAMLEMLAKAESAATAATIERMLVQNKTDPAKIAAATSAQTALVQKETIAIEQQVAALLEEANAYRTAALSAERYSMTTAGSSQVSYNKQMYMQRTQEAALLMNAQRDAAKSSATLAVNTEKAKTNMGGAALSTVAMGLSLAAMMGPFGKFGDKVGQILLFSTIFVPAIKAANVAVAAGAVKMAALRASGVGAMAAARGFGAAMAASLGPIGIAVTLLVTIATVGLAIWKQHKKTVAEQNKQSDILSKQNRQLDEQLGIRMKILRLKPPTTYADAPGVKDAASLADDLMSTKSGKELVKTYKEGSAGPGGEKETLAIQTYIDALQAVGGDAEKARRKIEALFYAADEGALGAQEHARAISELIGGTVSPAEIAKQWSDQINNALDETEDAAKTTGSNLGENLAREMASALNKNLPEDALSAIDNMAGVINKKYDDIFSKLTPTITKSLHVAGIDGGKALAQALQDSINLNQGDFASKYKLSLEQVTDVMAALRGVSSGWGKQLNNIWQIENGITSEIASQYGITEGVSNFDQLRSQWAIQLLGVNRSNVKSVYDQYLASKSNLGVAGDMLGIQFGLSKEQKLQLANQAAHQAHLKVTNNLAEQEWILAHASNKEYWDKTHAVEAQAGAQSRVNQLLANSMTFTPEQKASVYKAGMQGVMDDAATSLQAGFDASQKRAQDSLQSYWDKRLQINDRNAERESNRLDHKWEVLHAKTDAKWERRKDAANTYWDNRINNVDKAIEAEQAAEDIREKIFEAEKTRIERLTQMANTNIDFNAALNSGNLDEAAKIRNDMQATAADWALSDAGGASKDASDARVKALNDQKDSLEKQKDLALKNLDALEKANQASLDKREKQEKKHLDRMQKARSDALKVQEQNANNALARRQAYEAAAFDKRLTLFKSYIGVDQADLERWMKQVGISYDQFGGSLKTKGETWSTWFQTSMVNHMKTATNQIISDNMWTNMGNEARKDMFHAMGFKGIKEFANFIQTGNLPANYGSRDLSDKKTSTPTGALNPAKPRSSSIISQHVGGEVGVDAGGRDGVARSLKGLHPTEMLINAQKGEYIVNRRAAQEYKPLLQAINTGRLDSPRNIGNGIGGDEGVQVPGLAMGIAATMLVKGITSAMMQKKNETEAANTVSTMGAGAVFAALKAGKFGGRNFDTDQLNNAAIIAEVGSGMGMSRRDIEIGIMTAITESGLRNLKYGDRDSQGLFQQRPSQGWGTVEQVTNPRYAANAFFSHLKAISKRNDMSPWMAAQAVQRSAFSDGSNYKQYWDEAIAIFTEGITASGGGFTAKGGKGGYQRASIPGKGWMNSHDYRNGLGSPLFAADDGRIIESRAITSGGSPGNGLYGNKYRSYGETIVLLTDAGDRIRYAHLNPNTRAHTGPVKGGALIGRSGMTGNATGPHTHFEINGQEIAREWFIRHGIGLDTGGYTTSDGLANLHKDEVVISPERTAALYDGLDKFSAAMNSIGNIGNGVGGGTSSSFDYASRLFGVGSQNEFATTDTNLRDHPPAPPPKPAVSTSTDSGKAMSLRTGTFNLFNHLSAKAQIHDLKELIKRSDILSLSEFNHGKAVGDWLRKQGWGVYDGHRGDTALAWNKRIIGGVSFGTTALNPKHSGPAGLMHRFAEYGLFRDNKSGRQFYQASLHTVPARNAKHNVGTVKQRNAIQKEQAANIQKLYDRLRKTGKPVIMGGDINRFIAAMIKRDIHGAGNNTFQMLGNLDSTRSVTDKTGWNSDHPAVLAKYNMPALKTGGYTMNDGMAQLHSNELVVDPARTKVLLEGIDNFASGSNATYNVHMNVNGDTNVDELVNKTMLAFKRMEARKPQSRRAP